MAGVQQRMGELKGEMMNRETSYNKTFSGDAGGAKLNVAAAGGVMDWLIKSKNKDGKGPKTQPPANKPPQPGAGFGAVGDSARGAGSAEARRKSVL